MRFNLKALVGIYQCVGAVPVVFNVAIPQGLEGYAQWIEVLEVGFGLDAIIEGTCVGSYSRRLLLASCWPIALLLLATAGCVGWEWTSGRKKKSASLSAASVKGLQRVLPFSLVVTFLLVPSTATLIFKTFLCDAYEYSALVTHKYLHDDLKLNCSSSEYAATRNFALVLVCVWPFGVPIAYGLLLLLIKDDLLKRRPTQLNRATAFLWADYHAQAFWWEPFEMCRKLVVTGWVLLVPEDKEQLRVLLAILVSVSFAFFVLP